MTLFYATSAADAFTGASSDEVSYANAPGRVVVFIHPTYSPLNEGWATGDSYDPDIRTYYLSGFADYFLGDGLSITVYGGDGDDAIYGGAGVGYTSTLYGEDGDDTFLSGAGTDILYGGNGRDTADYRDAPAAVIASLANPSANTGWAAGDLYYSIQDLQGSVYGDTLYSVNDGLAHQLVGDPGIGNGVGGNDILYGATGANSGYTNFIPGAGTDTLYGGDGGNLIDYETAGPAGVTVDLYNPANNTGDAAGDVYNNLLYALSGRHTDIAGSMFGDSLYGDDGNNVILGDPDNPPLYPTGTPGIFYHANGSDVIDGGGGSDNIVGGNGADALWGGSGNDNFFYMYEADSTATMTVWDPGTSADVTLAGYDIIHDFVSGTDSLVLDAGLGTAVTSNVALVRTGGGTFLFADDLMIGVTTAVNGSDIQGLTAGVTIVGDNGYDLIYGSSFGDVIIGGGGADHLEGGAGADRFVYQATSDSTLTNADIIADFMTGDQIDLRSVHTGSDSYGIGYMGGGSFIFVDIGNDGINDMLIQVVGTVTTSDILW